MIADLETTPHLRFSGFDAPWEARTVGKAYRLQGGYAFKSEDFATEGVPVIRISNVTARGIDLSGVKYHPEIRNERAFVIGNGDLLIAMSGATTGKTCTYSLDQRAYLNQRVGLFRRLGADHDTRFLTGYVGAKKFQDSLSSLLVAGAQPNIGSRDIESIPFAFPTLPEQRKIADFLTAVDGRIGQLSQKKALLEDYKKGVMQQLFTQALRFKDDHGNDFPEWEKKKLGEVGAFKNGVNKDKSEFGFGTPFVNLMDVFGKRVLNQENFGLINSTEKERSSYDLRAGDVLFIRSSVKRTGVGEAIIIVENIEAAVYSGFLIRFRQKGRRLTSGFMTYCFASPAFRKELLSYATTSANTNINQESLAEVAVAIPSLPEQTKIANFLTALDRKIESVSQQITHTQTFKKGLLQQMFV